MSFAASSPVHAFLQSLALLVDGIGECIAGRREWDRLSEPLFASALMHVQRLFARVQRGVLAAEARAFRPAPAPPPRGAAKSGKRRKRPLPEGEVALPRGFGWLIRLAPGAQIYGAGLADILDAPGLPDLLAHAPQARRSLRALCIMLGTTVPDFLRPRPRRGSSPGAARTDAAGSGDAEMPDTTISPAAGTGTDWPPRSGPVFAGGREPDTPLRHRRITLPFMGR